MPHEVKRWTMPSDYFGTTWPGYFSSGFGQSRDSNDLEASNFATVLQELGGESNTVVVVRESHWAVGWVEWIAIHQDDVRSIDKANELCKRANDYPVLDEEDFSEREQEHANIIWRDCYSAKERINYIREHRSQFDFYDYADLLAVARGNYFSGYASELIY